MELSIVDSNPENIDKEQSSEKYSGLNKREGHGKNANKCEVCKRSYLRKSDLIRHSNVHTSKTPFTCNICVRSFANEFSLVRHRRTYHTGKISYECECCQTSFFSRKI